MLGRSRAVALGVLSAALVAGSGWGASSAFGVPQRAHKSTVVFKTLHVAGAKGLVLVEGPGLVVYTFTGDTRGKAGTCRGACAAVWPAVRGVPAIARGVKLPRKFGRINGQITYNGWPLYLFAGETPRQNNADSSFKVVAVPTSARH
jgi:predicted lipoprotein with Yx(FWY)xxD motif